MDYVDAVTAPSTVSPPPPGRLTLFFGPAPGAGKTWALLQAAQALREEGREVVLAPLDPRIPQATRDLSEGLERLPPRRRAIHGEFVESFDLEDALARRPAILVLDSLAERNPPGSRHEHRWQDAWDLLDAGMDVMSTLNVQSLESLSDAVARITGLRERATVPDTLFLRADDLRLVDVPIAELQRRVAEGTAFLPEIERHATERFFQEESLLALRELTFRRASDHAEARLRNLTGSHPRSRAASERLLAAITPHPDSARLIRTTRRLAENLRAPWLVAHVESPRLRTSQRDRAQLEAHLQLAESLGAEILLVQANGHLAQDLIGAAATRGATRILIGRPQRPFWLRWVAPSLLEELVRLGEGLDVMVVARDHEAPPPAETPSAPPGRRALRDLIPALHLLGSAAAVALATALAWIMDLRRFELADLVMVYVLAILAVATRFGRWAALAASALSAAALDWWFIEPRHAFGGWDPRHSGTFAVLIILGLVIGNLAERLRDQVRQARAREARARALLDFSAQLAQAGGQPPAMAEALRKTAAPLGLLTHLLLPAGPAGRLQPVEDDGSVLPEPTLEAASWSLAHGELSGPGTPTFPLQAALCLPLPGGLGVLCAFAGGSAPLDADQRHLLTAMAQHLATHLDRGQLSTRSIEAQQRMDHEQMRSALLTSVSRDLRTPVSTLQEEAESLRRTWEGLPPELRNERLDRLAAEAQGLQRRVANLLDLSRLESGALELHRTSVAARPLLEDALARLKPLAGDREIRLELPKDLPPFLADPALMEQAVVNLLENAFHFTPPGSPVELRAWATERSLTLAVADHGPGFPEGQEQRALDKLVAFPNPYARPGAGLGLALAREVAEAHGGFLQVANRPQGGAQILLSLPRTVSAPA